MLPSLWCFVRLPGNREVSLTGFVGALQVKAYRHHGSPVERHLCSAATDVSLYHRYIIVFISLIFCCSMSVFIENARSINRSSCIIPTSLLLLFDDRQIARPSLPRQWICPVNIHPKNFISKYRREGHGSNSKASWQAKQS